METWAVTDCSAPAQISGARRRAGDGRIIFDSQRNGANELYAMNADGSNVVKLTDSAGAEAKG